MGRVTVTVILQGVTEAQAAALKAVLAALPQIPPTAQLVVSYSSDI